MIRIIPVLLLKNGVLVRSTGFGQHRVIGDPFLQCARFNSWLIDELIYLDISDREEQSSGRRDIRTPHVLDVASIQGFVAKDCLVPLTWGGRLRTYDDAAAAIDRGADKVVFTTALATSPKEIERTAARFGQQAVCAGIDYTIKASGVSIMIERGTVQVRGNLMQWVQRAIDSGAGEILLHAIDRDGTGSGYDLDILSRVLSTVEVPVVVLGGARTPEHLAAGALAGASGVAAANMWHFSDNVDVQVRRYLSQSGGQVRRV